MADLRLIVSGAAGRMGRMVVRTIHESDGFKLTGALEREDSPWLGQDPALLAGCPAKGLQIVADPLPLLLDADAIIDFSSPAASVALAGLAAQARIADVIGTTGLSDDDLDKIDAAARHAPIVRSGNMSIGVNLLAALTRRAASALGEDFDIEIVEMHHRMKVDAPSGTALLLGEAAAEGRGVSLKDHSARGRDGLTGARRMGDIGFASLRGGTVVGDHSVIFAGEGERVTLSHHAEDRALFARGALKAVTWAKDRKPGLYSMADVLGLSGTDQVPLSPTASLRGDGFRAVEIEFRRLFRLARMNLNGERHAGRAFQEDHFVLNPVGAKDEIGERPVGGDRLTGTTGLRQVDDRGRIFRRGVLVALEGEVDEEAGRRVAAERAPFGSVDEALAAAHEIVGELARVFQKRIGFDVDDLELRRPAPPASTNETTDATAPTRSPPIFLPQSEIRSKQKNPPARD